MVMKIKEQKAQKSVSQNKNSNSKTIKVVQQQINLKMKKKIEKKNDIEEDGLREIMKNSQKTID